MTKTHDATHQYQTRSRPVIAVQFDGTREGAGRILAAIGSDDEIPIHEATGSNPPQYWLAVPSSASCMLAAHAGDWIVLRPDGELLPVSHAMFVLDYCRPDGSPIE